MATTFNEDINIVGGSKGLICSNGSATVARIGDSSGAGFVQLMDSGGNLKTYLRTDGTKSYINAGDVQFGNYGAGTATFLSDGTITTSSDVTLKDVQRPFDRGLSDLAGIEPIVFRWKEESGLETEHEYTGFSSQNVRESIPEAVSEKLTLSDRPLIAALINAVKELSERIGALEAKAGDSGAVEV